METIGKPEIRGLHETNEIRNWTGSFRKAITSTRWIVSCPCHRRGEFAIAIVPSWEAALDIALLHGRTFHSGGE